ncbi:MAG: response regulator [Vicinamibacterales bacterium]|nr:response regulator [Vicinamibacterales bacterium]
MKALIVDDSRAIRLVLSRIMTDCGFEVAEARHGREALTYLQSHVDTDVALIDWNMPEMSGLELVQAVRDDDRLNGLRMMMVTTETEVSHIERALTAGANEYVMKPFSREIIEEKLHLLGIGDGSAHVA